MLPCPFTAWRLRSDETGNDGFSVEQAPNAKMEDVVKRMDEHTSEDKVLERAIFVKSENVRVFNNESSAWAVDLQGGKTLLFTPLDKAVYMACNGLDNGAQIANQLGLNMAHLYRILEKLFRVGFIKGTGNAAKAFNKQNSVICSISIEKEAPIIVFEASELEEENTEEKIKIWLQKGYSSLVNVDTESCSSEDLRPVFYFKNVKWVRHSELIDDLLEQWQQYYSEESEAKNINEGTAFAPFCVVFDSEELPRGSDFVNYCQGCASASRLCTWDRLSALGKLWCRLHTLNAEIIWRFPFEVLLEKEASAFSDCFKEEPIAAPRLAEAAEIAAMLLDTARKNFGLPESCCGRFPLSGISILPVVKIDNAEYLERVWPIFTQSNCSAFGFCLEENLLEAKSTDLENALLKGLDLCFNNGHINKAITIFPLTRWLHDLLGKIPRREDRQTTLRSSKPTWLKNKCYRCVNWHFCACSVFTPSLPCHFMSTWAPLLLRKAAEADSENIKD